MLKQLIFSAILLVQTPLWADPPAAQTPAAVPAAAVAADPAMNEMSGSVLSVDSDSQAIRLTLDGGYSVEFSYDSQTLVRNGGHDITVKDLGYGDQVTIRYIGKDLVARKIERTHKASAAGLPPPVAPAAAPAPAPTPPTVSQ